jgi:hypothetical protein
LKVRSHRCNSEPNLIPGDPANAGEAAPRARDRSSRDEFQGPANERSASMDSVCDVQHWSRRLWVLAPIEADHSEGFRRVSENAGSGRAGWPAAGLVVAQKCRGARQRPTDGMSGYRGFAGAKFRGAISRWSGGRSRMNVATTTAAKGFRAGYVMIEAGARGREVRIDRGGPSIAPICLTAGWQLRRTTISEYFKCCIGK